MKNRIDLHRSAFLALAALSIVTFTPEAKSDTKWKVGSKSAKEQPPAAKLPKKLPAKVVAAKSPAASSTSARKPASESESAGNPDMPLTAAAPSGNVLASAIPQKLAAIDPNSAVEIRGQARTLSMMLVLKNGKDSINFIKVRKDYRSEIAKTEY